MRNTLTHEKYSTPPARPMGPNVTTKSFIYAFHSRQYNDGIVYIID